VHGKSFESDKSNPFTIIQEISGRRENIGQSLFFARTKGM
jgi:hypothetical protein